MGSNLNPSQCSALVGVIDPDAYAAGTYTTGWWDTAEIEKALAIVSAGDFVATGVLSAKIQQATSSAGAGAKDVTALAITNLTQAGTDDNKQAMINVTAADLDFNNGFRYARLSVTLTTAGADMSAVVIGTNFRRGDGKSHNLTSVDEVVS